MSENNQRRNDIGGKIIVGVVLGIIALFFNASYNVAREAQQLAFSNKVEISVQGSTLVSMNKNICEIKDDIKEIKENLMKKR